MVLIMENVYVVWCDGASSVDKIFDSEKKAQNYIKNNKDAQNDKEDLKIDWEDYFALDPCEIFMAYSKFNVE